MGGGRHYDTRPMSKTRADRVDAERLAREGAVIERLFPLEDFARLADSLAKPAGQARAIFRFSVVEGLPGCETDVRARLWLTCQRCLEPVECEVGSASRLVFAADDGEAARVPADWDATLADATRVALGELAEDDVLLALPLVPMHGPGTRCAGQKVPPVAESAGEPERPATQRPFAQLKDLLKH